MAIETPVCCTTEAFELLRDQLPRIEEDHALIYGAIAVSMHQLEGIRPSAVEMQLQAFGQTIRQRVHSSQSQALLAHLHEYLFEELGFRGNLKDYYTASNSYLPDVLETRRGLPVTLSLIYKAVAAQLGLHAWGISVPGHFLVGVEQTGSTLLIDPFMGGRILSEEELRSRLGGLADDALSDLDELLQPVTNRQWLTRIIQNLLNLFGKSGNYTDVAAMLELEMLLWPHEARLERDLGLVLARCGLSVSAGIWLSQYLMHNPDDPQSSDLKQLLQVLKS